MENLQNAPMNAEKAQVRSALDIALEHIIEVEGRGFTDHPADKGGPTKFGITQNVLKEWRGRTVSANEVAALEENEARQIYKANYWERMNLGFVDDGDFRVPLCLMDQGVNRGTKTAIIMAQVMMNSQFKTVLQVDGVLGPKTVGAISGIRPDYWCREYIQAAQHGYWDIVLRKSDQSVFFKGWLNRTHLLEDMVMIGTMKGEPFYVPKPDESPLIIPRTGKIAPYNWALLERGQSEIRGSKDNARIVWYHSFTTLKATDDETPWCSSFICAALESNGFKSTRSAAAKSYLTYGVEGDGSVGDIVVMKRTGGHHVAFMAEKFKAGGSIRILGGNQSNQVCIQTRSANDVLAFRRVA